MNSALSDLLRNTGPSLMPNSFDLRLERVAGFSGTRRTRPTVLANSTESATRRVPSSQLPVVSMCRVLEERGGRRDYNPFTNVIAISIFARLDMRPMRWFTKP
ncbi:hypothetical protein BKA70DRAFT_1430044 [Coprinopsis sp. MPI-PUGE-AT-0042]|nr:hypothetical protein BKA70DRAFT_1430044 [Coprinopsis sp. MPI-PUGE-AT-0042]